MNRIVTAVLAAASLTTPALAQLAGSILKVPQQFSDIQQAIDHTALAGSNLAYTIVVDSGTYSPFEIDPQGANVSGKLVIIAEEGTSPIVRSSQTGFGDTVTIGGLDLDDVIVLRNLEIQRTSGEHSAVRVESGQGSVWIEGCDMPAPGPGFEIPCGDSPALDIDFTGQVYLIGGLVEGIDGYVNTLFEQACSGSAAVRSVGANLAVWDCVLSGGNGRPAVPGVAENGQGGFPALDFAHGGDAFPQVRLYLSGCALDGGGGGDGGLDSNGNCGNGGQGGDGLETSGGNYRSLWLDTTFAGGSGGAAGSSNCSNGIPGQPTVQSGPGTLEMIPGKAKTLTANTPKRDNNTPANPNGELFAVDGEGDVGEAVGLFAAPLFTSFVYLDGWNGILVANPTLIFIPEVIQPPGVPITYFVSDVAQVQAVTTFVQGVIIDDLAGTVLTAPTAVTHIDFPN